MADDTVFLKERTNYIIVVRRSGQISDVWKLDDTIVRYADDAKGWHIQTSKGAAFFVSGDVEIWHIEDKESALWNMYRAYHAHSAKGTYRELFTDVPPPEEPPPPPEEPKKKRLFKWPYTIKWNWG